MGVFRADFVGHLEKCGEGSGIDAGVSSGFLNGGEDLFGGDVADESVAGEGAAAESGECGVEAAATGFVGSQNFGFGVFGAAVEVDAEFDAGDVIFYRVVELADLFGGGGADGVGEGDGVDADVFEPFERVGDYFGAPGFVVGIAEGHRDINDQAAVRRSGGLL